ncbi:hypothetical protein [Mucilaginibacter rubeus]|uniref:Uncharacterized protein n=1 Tax=Mucilaginibacter rubeus TaxID=2027860 RepID=A0A5C1HVZ4_9SPHI|nr:hypothetical protein [Mucilaginibacter rubeus]QEM09251.1 hypothetical protein DEO27_004210 [Mucilaginibacter rubeus]
MPGQKLTKEEKIIELNKFRDLVLATIDYLLADSSTTVKTESFDSNEYFDWLKGQAIEHHNHGRLTRLKQWFRDLTEPIIEGRNLNFNGYLYNKTGYKVNVFDNYFKRVEAIIERGKVTTNNQFYDIGLMINQLCNEQSMNKEKIQILNDLLSAYESGNPTKNAT